MLSNRVNGESFDRTLATISISFGAKKRSETLNDVNLWRAFGIAIYTYRYIYVYICLLIMCAYYCSLLTVSSDDHITTNRTFVFILSAYQRQNVHR